jgi:polyribonucleotide nucleotidyltransferase
VPPKEIGREFYREVEEKVLVPLSEAMRIKGKLENYDRVDQVLDETSSPRCPRGGVERGRGQGHLQGAQGEGAARRDPRARQRLDGRKFDEVRPIWIEVGVLPRTHGSAVFTRGETQALVTATLGTADDQQKIEMVDGETYKRFMLHYNFPPFSVGEVAFLRGPGRREVGHGALAERALAPVCPPRRSSPTRSASCRTSSSRTVVVDGVGLRRLAGDDGRRRAAQGAGGRRGHGPHHGRATGKYAVLSDIAGAEDHYGDMDFKVAGTAEGITALQMDIKVAGITSEVMRKALEQARKGRLHILDKMEETLAAPRTQHLDLRAAHRHDQDPGRQDPRRHRPGGKMIRSIIERTGVKIDVEDDGRVNVASADEASAPRRHRDHPGADGDARAEQDLPGQGAAHHRLRRVRRDHAGHRRPAARLGDRQLHRVKDVRDELKEGEQFLVKVINIDPSGKIRLRGPRRD